MFYAIPNFIWMMATLLFFMVGLTLLMEVNSLLYFLGGYCCSYLVEDLFGVL